MEEILTKIETVLVLLDMPSLIEKYGDHATRVRWGVVANPVLKSGFYILPLGWGKELDKAGILYEVKDIEIEIKQD